MTKLKKRLHATPLLAVLCLMIAGTGAAFARHALTANSNAPTGHAIVKVKLDGSVRRAQANLPLVKAGAVNPGETLDWKITNANEGDGAARDYKVVGQIPAGTTFIAGSTSADGGAAVTYSIDHGQTFDAQPTIAEKQADGTVKRVAAPIALYTQVRYEWADPLAAGGMLTASYQVRVK